jgi:L-threonylcarbamoyladenylate synthase
VVRPTRVLKVDPYTLDPEALREAAALLRRGGLVAFPTETVYGLGAHALDPAAVAAIFEAKGRPSTDPLIVHLAAAAHLSDVCVDIPPDAFRLADAFWPGPLTILLPKATQVPDVVTAGLATVGVRVPAHAVAQALLRAARVPIAAPSANRFSRPSPTRAEHVLADLSGAIDMVIDAGPTTVGVESTIVDLTVSPALIRRPGGITVDQLARVIPSIVLTREREDVARPQSSPGQLLRHYAPRARLTLYVGGIDAVCARVAVQVRGAVARGERVGVLAPAEDLRALAPRLAASGATGRVETARCGTRTDRAAAARELFEALRALDASGVDVIYAIAPDGNGINTAIVDRLTRAAEGRVVIG